MSIVTEAKKMIPVNVRNGIKKALGMKPSPYITIVKGSSLLKEASHLEKNLSRNLTKNIDSNITCDSPLGIKTQAIDQLIEDKLYSKKYTFYNLYVIVDPYHFSPLSALALFRTNQLCSVKVTVKGIQNETDVTGMLEPSKYHRVPIMGLYPNKSNQVLLELFDIDNNLIDSRTIKIRTSELPASLQDAVQVEESGGTTAFGLTLVSGKSVPYPFAYDKSGTIRYFLNHRPRGYGLFPLANGHFIFVDRQVLIPTYEIPHSTQIYEMDYFGRVHKTYFVEKGGHHDIHEKTPGGNLLMVSNSMDNHVEDVILEIDRTTGDIVKSLDMREIFHETYCNLIDWVHINTISYDEKSRCVLISPRNLHSLVKVNWDTKELIWILCDPRFWEGTNYIDKVLKPVGDISWHYQQHAAYQLSDDLDGNPNTNHYIMFDNHWHKRRRVKFFDNDELSYAKIYTVDEINKTVKLEHKYAGVKSKITSNALLDFAKKRVFSMGGYLEPLIDDRQGMIYEYDYDTEKVINQYSIKYFFYRAYEFVINYNCLATPMVKDKNYLVGHLEKPVLTNETITDTQNKLPEDANIDYIIKEDIFHIQGFDHLIKKVYFVGKNKTYVRDMSRTYQTSDLFKDMLYYTAIPLSDLVNDTYKIYVSYCDTIYNSEKHITLS